MDIFRVKIRRAPEVIMFLILWVLHINFTMMTNSSNAVWKPVIAPLLLKNVSKEHKNFSYLDEFKKTKFWTPENFLCKICETFVHQIMYIWKRYNTCLQVYVMLACFSHTQGVQWILFSLLLTLSLSVSVSFGVLSLHLAFLWQFFLFCIHDLTENISQLQ